MSGFPLLSTLRARLMVYGCLFLAAILLLVGYIAFFQSKAALREVQARNLDNLVVRVAADIDDRIRTRHVLLEQAAASLQLSPEQFDQQGAGLISRFRYLKGMFNSILLYDRQGNIIADYPTLPGRQGSNVADADYFMNTRELLRPQISEPLRVRGGLSRTVIVFSAPIFSPEGVFAGVLGGSLELYSPEFFGELKNITLGQSGFLTINTIRSHLTIMHSDPAYIMQASPSAELNPTLHRAFAGWQGQTEAISNGTPSLVGYRRLQNAPWVVGVVMPLHEAMLPAHDIGQRFVLLILGAMLLAMPLGWWGLRRQLRILPALRHQLAAQQSDPQQRLPLLGCTELQAIARDVGAICRERAALAVTLAARDGLLQAIRNGSPLGMLIIDQQGRLLSLNQAAMRLGGLPDTASVSWEGRHWLDAIHPESLQQVALLWQRLLAQGGGFDVLCRLKHQDDVRVMVELHFAEVTGKADDRSFLGLVQDVSSREVSRSQLQAERERGQLVLSAVRDAVVLTNQADEVEYVNAHAVALFGLPASDMLGRLLGVLMSLVSPESGLPVPLRGIERDHAGKAVELDLVRRDLRVQPVLLTLSVMSGNTPLHGYKVVVLHDDAERRQRQHLSSWEAGHDVLTGLMNRRALLVAVTQMLREADAKLQHGLAIMDLDHFRQVNEMVGMPGGDLLLQDVAGILQRHVRASDVIARLEGDEFAILLYNCSRETAGRILGEILRDVAAHVLLLADRKVSVSASIGFTVVRTEDVRAESLIARAAARCAQAKQQGRNGLVMSRVA